MHMLAQGCPGESWVTKRIATAPATNPLVYRTRLYLSVTLVYPSLFSPHPTRCMENIRGCGVSYIRRIIVCFLQGFHHWLLFLFLVRFYSNLFGYPVAYMIVRIFLLIFIISFSPDSIPPNIIFVLFFILFIRKRSKSKYRKIEGFDVQ